MHTHTQHALVSYTLPARTPHLQDPYKNRDVFQSLQIAWDLLERFDPEELKQIPKDIRFLFYSRQNRDGWTRDKMAPWLEKAFAEWVKAEKERERKQEEERKKNEAEDK